MAIDYVNKAQTVVDVLRSFNTTTAAVDLSASLTTRIASITVAEPDMVGARRGDFPCVFVSIARASEAETQIGDYSGRRKQKTINYEIWGFYKKEGISKTQSANLKDMYQLASNIEAVLKRNGTFSSTALHIGGVDTDFKQHEENNLIKALKIETQVSYFYT
jgi:hypothetical protein